MSSVKIKKAKIVDSLFLEGEYTENLPGHSKMNQKFSCTVPVHDDLKESFKKLHRHLAILCDEIPTPKKRDFPGIEINDFEATGFSIGGRDENEGVTISGSKEGKFGTVNLNSPFKKFSDTEYPFIADLGADITHCIHEVEQYLFHEKRAPEQQLSMKFGGTEGDNLSEDGI